MHRPIGGEVNFPRSCIPSVEPCPMSKGPSETLCWNGSASRTCTVTDAVNFLSDVSSCIGIQAVANYVKVFRLRPLDPDHRMDPSRIPTPDFLRPQEEGCASMGRGWARRPPAAGGIEAEGQVLPVPDDPNPDDSRSYSRTIMGNDEIPMRSD